MMSGSDLSSLDGVGSGHRRTSGSPTASQIGTMVGFCAWAVALAFVVLWTGEEGLALRVVVPSLFVSAALGSVACLVLGLVDRIVRDARACDEPAAALRAQRVRVDAILACVFCSCAALLFYVDAAVVPMLAQSPRVADAVQSTGGSMSLPLWQPALCAVLGVWRAWVAIVRLRG